jgi:hypothetical protein
MYNNRQLYHLDCHEFVVILGISMNWKAIDPDGPDDDEDDFARDDARSSGKSQFYIACYPVKTELNRIIRKNNINIIHHQTCLGTLHLFIIINNKFAALGHYWEPLQNSTA